MSAQQKRAIYLDFNASAPLRPEVLREFSVLFEPKNGQTLIPNPSSIHSHGRSAKKLMTQAKDQVALSLGASIDSEQLIFTSGATEANQTAIQSAFDFSKKKFKQPHWILSATEHDSCLQMIELWKTWGGQVDILPVKPDGLVSFEAFDSLVKPETALLSLMWVNNETGVIQDIQKWSQIARSRNCLFHVDAAQAWGKLDIDLNALNASYVTFSGHKIGALQGAGILWLNRGVALKSLIQGKQEKGRRGGTENLLGLVSLGIAAKTLDPKAWQSKVEPLRDHLENAISSQISGSVINGKSAPRIANTTNLVFDAIEGDGLVMALDLEGFSVSSGSACSSGVLEPSHVLLNMGLTKGQAMAALRVSISESTSKLEIDQFVEALKRVVERMRSVQRSH